jgi:hypothetical protein
MIDSLDTVKTTPRLYAEAKLPKAAADLQPFTSPMNNIKVGTTGGNSFRIGADGKLVPGDALAPGDGVRAPEGTPAPATPTPAAPAGETPKPAGEPGKP